MTQPALFTPISIRSITMRNRIWVPPMCMYSALNRDGKASSFHYAHLGAMALGGAGLVIQEATAVTPEGRITFHDLGLWNDEQRDVLAPIVEFVKSTGAVAGIQLAHAGRKASTAPDWGYPPFKGTIPVEDGGWQTLAPSAIAFPGYDVPREMTTEEVQQTVRDFASAAKRAKEAGYQVIELHAAHGYLLHEFLSPMSNQRTDDYGGPLKNRARLLLEIVEAVRAEIGEDLALFIRFSATDWVEGGWNEEETAIVTDWAKDLGADLIDVSSGGNVTGVKIEVGPGYQVPLAHFVKQHAHLPVAAVGLITTAQLANEIVEDGRADAVLVGREHLRDPRFALRAAAELGAEIDYLPGQYGRAPFKR
jgi:2,4-dienoyl-CoA reductase-like NADH-dependent reductase (Old Yellow Enzyme family)